MGLIVFPVGLVLLVAFWIGLVFGCVKLVQLTHLRARAYVLDRRK